MCTVLLNEYMDGYMDMEDESAPPPDVFADFFVDAA